MRVLLLAHVSGTSIKPLVSMTNFATSVLGIREANSSAVSRYQISVLQAVPTNSPRMEWR